MKLYHIDTDFLIYAVESNGPERSRVFSILDSGAELQLSAVAWYEFYRHPATPSQLAVSRSFIGPRGIVEFTETLASRAADTFRALGSPRRRAADIAIGITAASCRATLLTRNARDFDGVPNLTLDSSESP